MIRALFVNSGILGLKTFAGFVERAFAADCGDISATQVVLTENLSLRDRAVRRLLCARLWRDGVAGTRNLDRFRYRAELNSGLLARRRIAQLEASGKRFDVFHFHRQAAAYASLDLMRTRPAIVSIDCTQRCVVERAANELEARSYLPNVRRDGDIFNAAQLIVATSAWAAHSVRTEYPACTPEIAVMPNPGELSAFDSGWATERYARAVATPDYRPRVLFMGGDFARKGGYDLLDAWRTGRFFDRATLDIVTSFSVDPRRVPQGATIHPRVNAHTAEWRALWRSADVFAMPTHDEAFGLVFQEASAAGLPAIGTRINAIPELIEDGASGLLIEPHDRDALTRALDTLLTSPDRRKAMGDRARALIEQTADATTYRDRLAAAIRQVSRGR